MQFTNVQHKRNKRNRRQALDPPGSSAPGRRQAGPGGQRTPQAESRPAVALTRHGRGQRTPVARPARGCAHARRDATAAHGRRGSGSARGAGDAHAPAVRHSKGARPRHGQAGRGGERRRGGARRRRREERVGEKLRAEGKAASGRNRTRRGRRWCGRKGLDGGSPMATGCGGRRASGRGSGCGRS
jgi:hypothetical protein